LTLAASAEAAAEGACEAEAAAVTDLAAPTARKPSGYMNKQQA